MAGVRSSIAGYQIQSVIMEGKNSTVYAAVDYQTRWEVAIKTVTKGAPKFQLRGRQLRWEYRLRDLLIHQNIIKILKFGQTHSLTYLVMEYFRSRNLRSLMQTKDPLLKEKGADIVRQLVAALSHVHQKGLVHRDVKPENILVSSSGAVKLIDFAIAVMVSQQWKRWLGIDRGIRGTRTYMSPEQIMGQRLDQRSDIYSLGVVLYELLADRPPFMDMAPAELLASHLEDSPPPLSQLVPEVHPGFEELVMMMLNKLPAMRPQDLVTVQRRLREVTFCR